MRIEVKNGCFAYKKGTPVLDNMDFSLQDGDVCAVLGANGVGKTTMLRCLTGMLKWNKGNTFIDSTPIKAMTQKKLWSVISYVPQAKSVISSQIVTDFILLGLSNQIGFFSSPSKRDIQKAVDTLSLLGIEKLKDNKCNELSGGEFQMVLIAKALIKKPKILILDEPESNLDYKNQLIVLDTVSSLAQKGMICIFNTHYPDHALQRSNKALLLKKNDYMFGETNEIITRESILKYFGVNVIFTRAEGEGKEYQGVMPLKISSEAVSGNNPDIKSSLASISIIVKSLSASQRVNDILHEHSDIIVGRMGMPYRKREISVINIVVDGKKSEIFSLSQALSILPDVSTKTAFEEI